jgi:hypothetical protein
MDRPIIRQDEEKLYPIQYHEYYGITAGLMDGKQVLIRFMPNGFLLLTFSDSGDLVNTDVVPYTPGSTREAEEERIKRRVNRDKPTLVKKFFLEKPHLGIEDLPSNLREEIEEWDNLDDEEQEYYADLIRSWEADEQFVLQWDGEYYVNKHGKVVSS